MKKRLYSITTVMLSLALLSLSSCLKDNSYVDLSQVGTIVEFPLGGTPNFGADAITAPGPLDTVQFAVNVSSPTIPTTSNTVTIAVDNTIIASYLATNNAVPYIAFPANAYTLTSTSVTIPAGSRVGIFTLIIDKSKINPTLSYMLPIKIVSAGGLNVSGNQYIHYYHVIGNDFAGVYVHDFTRYNGYSSLPPNGTPKSGGSFTGNPVTVYPVTTTQFEVASGYYTGTARYEVSYTETGTYPTATYSNINISLNSDDVANIFNANGINVTTQPSIVGYNSSSTYTFAQVVALMSDFQYVVQNSSGYRFCIDSYHH